MRRKDRTRRPLPSPRTLQNPHPILRRPHPAHKDGCTAGYPVPTRQRAVKIHGIDILLGHDTNHCFRSQLVYKTLDGNAHLLEGIKAYRAEVPATKITPGELVYYPFLQSSSPFNLRDRAKREKCMSSNFWVSFKLWNVFNYSSITHHYTIQLLLVFVREECNLCDLMQLDQIRAVFCRIPSLIQPLYLAKLPANWNHKQLRLSPNISTSEADASERKRGKRLKSDLLGYEW